MSLAVAAVPRPGAIYREEQWFGWWLYAGLGLICALACVFVFDRTFGWSSPLLSFHGRLLKIIVASGVILPPAIVVGVLRMVTLVTPGTVRVSFGFLATYRRDITLDSIVAIEVIQYHPVRDYAGWGIRFGREGERVYNARGDRGVRMQLRDGSKVVIGSQRPEQLALAIEAARRPGI